MASKLAQTPDESALRTEIVQLGEMLGEVVAAVAGDDNLHIVETVRRLSRDFRMGLADKNDNKRLANLLGTLTYDQLRVVIRAFTVFLDLANMAEDRERVRVLQERARRQFPAPTKESIRSAIHKLKSSGTDAARMQEILDGLLLELVFTAHPTEAKRRTIRRKLRAIRRLLEQKDAAPDDPITVRDADESIRATLTEIWLTDFIRDSRPTVLQEVKRGLSFKPTLWNVTPKIMGQMRRALEEAFPDDPQTVSPCIQFGSWIGGDRDGHPFVTPEVTGQTLMWLHAAAIEFHLETCGRLRHSMSISGKQIELGGNLKSCADRALADYPELQVELDPLPQSEVFRRWLTVIRWRLQQTSLKNLSDPPARGSYASAEELMADVAELDNTLRSLDVNTDLATETSTWIDQIKIFGFHLARLDVRQDSRKYHAVVNELLELGEYVTDAESLSEEQRQRLLTDTIGAKFDISDAELSDTTRETLDLFALLRTIVQRLGRAALGAHVISMTNQPSDVLTVLWLWNWCADSDCPQPIPIVPLFETIEDLQNGPDILRQLLETPTYRALLKQQGDRQIVMLGYSDSTKDGGYLSACWSLYECQQLLHSVADEANVELIFFHGRGGSLGRGGGPAARSILSLPRNAFHGSLRLTEQGEVLADRYDDPKIAERHFEQLIWSSLLASGTSASDIPPEWIATMQRVAVASFETYRQLIEQPGFVAFFRHATPISQIERLPIGSRPARRKGGNSLSDLRAIPWVFSWTQARFLLPAWYGIGSAFAAETDDVTTLLQLQDMYREWPFFAATIDNAELALAKVDLGIAGKYVELAAPEERDVVWEMIQREFTASSQAILKIVDRAELLDGIPWLKESIQVRNWYIDPLNFIQVELLARTFSENGAASEQAHVEMDAEKLHALLKLTVNGIASGLRTTG